MIDHHTARPKSSTISAGGGMRLDSLVFSVLVHAGVVAVLVSELLSPPDTLVDKPIPIELVYDIPPPEPLQLAEAPEPEVIEEPEPEVAEIPEPEVIEEPEPEVAEIPEPEPEPLPEPEVIEEPEPEVAEAPEPEPEPLPEPLPEPEEIVQPPLAAAPAPLVPQVLELPAPPRPLRKPATPQELALAAEPETPPLEPDVIETEAPEPPEPETAAAEAEAPEAEAAYTHQGQIRQVGAADLLANLAALGDEDLQAKQNPELWEIIRMVRSQVARCWRMDSGNPWDGKYAVNIQVAFDQGGVLTKAQVKDVARTVTDDDYRAFVVEARGALADCSPFDLPADRYAIWRSFTLRFIPHYRS